MAKSTKVKAPGSRPYCFVSYSSGEPQGKLFIECLRMVFGSHIEVKATPSSLESGVSQLNVITNQIRDCMFGVVLLDGLRPNVVFEYGIMHGFDRPILLFKEEGATVDIAHLFGSAPVEFRLLPPRIGCDAQFSNVKDVNYVEWNRYDISGTTKKIWDEYCKKKASIAGFIEVSKPKSWQ